MKLIVGLGNPGEEYSQTRHNIGFMVVEKVAKELGEHSPKWEFNKKANALICNVGGVILAKPQTFMNASGDAVAHLTSYYKIATEDVWVIHDDIDLPLGKLKIRSQGASAGHNGVESIMKSLGTDKFVRMRLGIGRGKEDKSEKNTDQQLKHRNVISFVLSRFRESEAGDFRKLIKHGADAVQMALTEGIDKAMNRFN